MKVLGEGEDEAAVPELWGETSGSVTFCWHVSVVVCYSDFICTFNLLTIKCKKGKKIAVPLTEVSFIKKNTIGDGGSTAL